MSVLRSTGLLFLLLIIGSCSSEPEVTKQAEAEPTAAASTLPNNDPRTAGVQATLTEVARRLHYNDLAVLYDLEFEYLQDEVTFDEYLKFPQTRALRNDTIEAITVREIAFLGNDTAIVRVEAMFVGPTGDTSLGDDVYRMFLHRGRWIHPTVSNPGRQIKYENVMRAADSASGDDVEDW